MVKDLGNLAPKTNVERVVHSIARVWSGVVAALGRFERNATMDAMEANTALVVRPWKVRSEKAFGGGDTSFTSTTTLACSSADARVDTAGATDLSGLDEDDVSFRMPKTEKDVEKRVKKNPATMTVAILRTYSSRN